MYRCTVRSETPQFFATWEGVKSESLCDSDMSATLWRYVMTCQARHKTGANVVLCRNMTLMTVGTDRVVDLKRRSNMLIGERVHQHMWREGRTQRQLAGLLGVDQGAVSKRLHGKTDWTAPEVAVAAAWLGVTIADLVPDVVFPDDGGDDDSGAAGAPTRARTWDLRIKSP